ncbi:MAG: phage holin family protein [Candidatus Roizmanbacteria bacterium]
MGLILQLIIQALSVYVTAQFLPGVQITGLYSALLVAVTLGLVNIFIKPIISLFALPFTILTLGLFSLVINALMIMIVDYFVDGFEVSGFVAALLFSLILSIVSMLFSQFTKA